MKSAVTKLVLMVVCVFAFSACRSKNDEASERANVQSPALEEEQARVNQGIAVDESDDPSRWVPSSEDVKTAKLAAAAPTFTPQPWQGLAPGAQDPTEISLGGIERLPVPPQPPRFTKGDEADEYGLPAWEKMARGEINVRRIQY